MNKVAPRVLISYATQPDWMRVCVRELADRLRSDGIDAWIDQYAPPPNQGWSYWMQEQLKCAERVIIACGEQYAARALRCAPPGEGLGVSWEYHFIRQEIYRTRGAGSRFIPVIFSAADADFVPPELWDRPRYLLINLDSPDYSRLLCDIFQRPPVAPPALGLALPPLPAWSSGNLPASGSPDWRRYCEELRAEYREWLTHYAPLNLAARGSDRRQHELFPLLVREPNGNGPRQVSDGVAAIRKRLAEHVLVLGPPGSGKSTLLTRFILEEAEVPPTDQPRVPILIKLKDWTGTFLGLIRFKLLEYDIRLEEGEIDRLLSEGQFALLFDGVNELPSGDAVQHLAAFQRRYRDTTPMLFTTRSGFGEQELKAGARFELEPLSDDAITRFVGAYFPSRPVEEVIPPSLRDVVRQPLLLKMICSVADQLNQTTGPTIGMTYRAFVEYFEGAIKSDISADLTLRPLWAGALRALAYRMLTGDNPAELLVTLDRRTAEVWLADFLHSEGEANSAAQGLLRDLLRVHLLSSRAPSRVEFVHQSFMEYFGAEHLLGLMSQTPRDVLIRDFLNRPRWTEPLRLLVGLLDEETEALGLVRSALDVDPYVAARLVGGLHVRLRNEGLRLLKCSDYVRQAAIYEATGLAGVPSFQELIEQRYGPDWAMHYGYMYEDAELRELWKIQAMISPSEALRALRRLSASTDYIESYRLQALRSLQTRHGCYNPDLA